MTTIHMHTWVRHESDRDPRQWRCSECPETSATCLVCEGASGRALLICDRCERRERFVLDCIDRILAQASGVDGGGSGPYRLVMVNGSGVDQVDRTDTSVDGRLQRWVARWSEHTQNEGLGATDYLRSRILWAVHNPEASSWLEYRDDVRRIRGAALASVGLAPEELPDRCGFCHRGRLVQDRADYRGLAHGDGLQDTVRCTGCHMEWSSRSQARIVVKQRIFDLPHRNPEALVTLEQAHKILAPVPMETLRSWVKRDREVHVRSVAACDAWDDEWSAWEDAGNVGPIPLPPEIEERQLPECGRRGGRALYRLGDLAALAHRRVEDGRPGRRAG